MLGFNFLYGGEISFAKMQEQSSLMFVTKYKYHYCWLEGTTGT